jgi:galactokinase
VIPHSNVYSVQGLVGDLEEIFRTHFEGRPQIALTPGRINLIGEHTDYNDGFVLPMAIDRYVGVAFAPRAEDRLRVYAADFEEIRTIPLDGLHPERFDGWSRYVAGIAWTLREAGLLVPGGDFAIHGNVPIGSGLSSSAALAMAVARALFALGGTEWDPTLAAKLGQRAENEFVGVPCGIMDHFAAAASGNGTALLLDCRSLEIRKVSIPESACVIVMDTGVRRQLTDGIYNERFDRCQEAVRVIRRRDSSVKALRDVSVEKLQEFRNEMDPTTFRRSSHVVAENWRPVEMADALEQGDLQTAGRLMGDSHASLRDLYDVSCEELDYMVELAAQHSACYGARLTGAGMGGCAVALVDRAEATDFIDTVGASYRSRFNGPSSLFRCEPSEGARLLSATHPSDDV